MPPSADCSRRDSTRNPPAPPAADKAPSPVSSSVSYRFHFGTKVKVFPYLWSRDDTFQCALVLAAPNTIRFCTVSGFYVPLLTYDRRFRPIPRSRTPLLAAHGPQLPPRRGAVPRVAGGRRRTVRKKDAEELSCGFEV